MALASRRRLLTAAVTAAAALALSIAISGRGCSGVDSSPEAVARAFVVASREGDRRAVWDLLGPATRRRLEEAAQGATEKVGGARRFAPLDMIDVRPRESTPPPVDVVVREESGRTAVVEIVNADGQRDRLTTVEVDGRWRVELSP